MRKHLTGSALLLLAFLGAAKAESFPCEISEYRIEKPTVAWFRCPAAFRGRVSGDVQIAELNTLGLVTKTLAASLTFDSANQRFWERVELKGTDSLEPSRTYKLIIQGSFDITPEGATQPVSTAVKPSAYSFDTKPDTPIAVEDHCPGEKCLIATSNIALSGGAVSPSVGDNPPSCNSLGPISRLEDLGTPGEIRQIGRFRIHYPSSVEFKGDVDLCASGLENIFHSPLKLKSKVKAEAAPKDKASSQVYAKLLSQAGPGAKPGWAADIKLSPSLLNLGNGFFFTPQILVDIGFGKVADTKSANTAKIGVGVTKTVAARRVNALAQGVSLAPAIAFETDRKGHHQNLLYDMENQIFLKNLLHSRDNDAKRAYAKALIDSQAHNEDPPDENKFPKKDFGWQALTFLGAETGSALSADQTKSEDEMTSVLRPTYRIARIRPKLSTALEYKRADITLTVVPRYLFATEKVTRETQIADPKNAGKTIASIYIKDARGFRPYGEVTLNIALERSGHIVLSSSYKLGSTPPNFDYISTVQTGLAIRY